MLVLSRRVGETLELDGGITICVVEIHGQQVRLAITAPKTTRIMRGELVARPPKPTPGPPATGQGQEG